MWQLQRSPTDAADFETAATISQEQQPFLQILTRAPGPISGLVWKDSTFGEHPVLVVGHSNNTGLRLFLVQDPGEGQVQQQQVRNVSRSLAPLAATHKKTGSMWSQPHASCHKQTLDLNSSDGGTPLFYQLALQQSSSLLLLADSRRTSLLALHIRGPRTTFQISANHDCSNARPSVRKPDSQGPPADVSMACAAEVRDADQPSVRFDHVAQFALAEPTLSVVTTAGEAVASDDGEPRLALYCVQPGGIRQLILDPALCQPSASRMSRCHVGLKKSHRLVQDQLQWGLEGDPE